MERLITVIGTGHFDGQPDLGILDLRISVERSSVEESTRAMADTVANVLSAVRAIPIRDAHTGRVSVRTNHDHKGKPSGFVAESTLRIECEAETDPGRVVAAAVGAGGDHVGVDGISFAMIDPEVPRRRALEAAIADARSRAEVAAAAVGVGLGQIISLAEQPANRPSPIRHRTFAEASDMAILPGSITTEASVEATFELT